MPDKILAQSHDRVTRNTKNTSFPFFLTRRRHAQFSAAASGQIISDDRRRRLVLGWNSANSSARGVAVVVTARPFFSTQVYVCSPKFKNKIMVTKNPIH
jgi:hypothetical protein